jgi:hypothetical protein
MKFQFQWPCFIKDYFTRVTAACDPYSVLIILSPGLSGICSENSQCWVQLRAVAWQQFLSQLVFLGFASLSGSECLSAAPSEDRTLDSSLLNDTNDMNENSSD